LRSVRNISEIRVRWDADHPCKLDQMGCLTQVGWKSPFHACANMFDAEIAYDLLIDNGRQLRPLTYCTVAISVPVQFLYRNRRRYGSAYRLHCSVTLSAPSTGTLPVLAKKSVTTPVPYRFTSCTRAV